VTTQRGGKRDLFLGRQRRAASKVGAPNFFQQLAREALDDGMPVASVASVTIASVDQPRLSIPRSPSATRRAVSAEHGRILVQNTKAPETAHSPGTAARSNTNVSDGSSLIVRGNFSMPASFRFSDRARADHTKLPWPAHPQDAMRSGRPAAGWRADQEVAIESSFGARLPCASQAAAR